MDLDALAALPEVEDVLVTATALYVLLRTNNKPAIFSDKKILFIPYKELLTTPHLPELLSAESIKHKQPLTRLKQSTLFEYSFSGLDQNTKQSISHALHGTGGRKSLLGALDGQRIGRGAIIIPATNQTALETFFAEHNVTYTTQHIYTEGSYGA